MSFQLKLLIHFIFHLVTLQHSKAFHQLTDQIKIEKIYRIKVKIFGREGKGPKILLRFSI